jgi:ATP-dependent helicase/nuclease subunit A
MARELWDMDGVELLMRDMDAAEEAEAREIVAQAARLIGNTQLADIFAPDTLAEVAFTTTLPDGRRMHGIMDRVIVRGDQVRVVDFKTNAVVPTHVGDVPEGLLRQMGAYRHALEEIYPGRRVVTEILWTETGDLMDLPYMLTREALARLDGVAGRP